MRKLLISICLALPMAAFASPADWSKDVEFSAIPDVPFVILNDTTIGVGEGRLTVKAPWFLAGFTIVNNNHHYTLMVPSLRIEATANGSDFEMTLDANAACPFYKDAPRVRYATVPPNTAHLGDEDCDDSDLSDRALFYISSLPDVDTTVYDVTVTLDGYMYNDDPIDDNPVKGRVQKIVEFKTQ